MGSGSHLCGVALLIALLLPARGSAAEYFVSPAGDDAGAGNIAQPFRTINRAVRATAAGDLVVVTPGTYREAVVIDRGGAAGAPIVLRGLPGAVVACPDPAASLSAIDLTPAAAHIVVQGFELTAGFHETVFVRPGAHDIELAGLDVHHNRGGIWIAGAHDVLVRDTHVHDNQRTGVRLLAGARDIDIIDTRAERHDDGLGCRGDADGFSADESTGDVRFERVTAASNAEDGFDLKAAGITLRGAVARDNGCSGLKLGQSAYLENVLVDGSHMGINLHGPPGGGSMVQNATLLDNGIGLRALGDGHQLTIRNSIISGPGKALVFAAGVILHEHFNLFWRPEIDDRLVVRVGDSGEERYSARDIADGTWARASGHGEATLALDPQLDASSAGPRAASPAVDSGTGDGVPAIDLMAVARPQGAAVDRGAFEYAPATAHAVLRRVSLHRRANGAGQLRLQLDVTLPSAGAFDPRHDAVEVSVRGSRGDLVRLAAGPESWMRPVVASAHRHRRAHTARFGGGAKLSLLTIPAGVRVLLRHEGAAWWTVTGDLDVTVTLGPLRAQARGVADGVVRRFPPR